MTKSTADTAIGWLKHYMAADDTREFVYAPAIEALKKQRALKPLLEGEKNTFGRVVYDTWYCPSCDDKHSTEGECYDFCPNCGQRIDWR